MSRASLSLAEVLDDAADTVSSVAAPWVGVLWLASLPLRLLQAHFVARVIDLGDDAGRYGQHLMGLAVVTGLALLVSLGGRAVFVRACGLGLRSLAVPGREALRVPAAGAACYLYTALLVEVLSFALGWTLVALPLLVLLAGLAAATFPLNERPGLVAPLRQITRHSGHGKVLFGLLVVFGVALAIAYVNLYFVFQLGLWLVGAIPGLDPAPWRAILGLENPRFHLVLGAGALLAVEPYWLGANVVYVHKLRSRQSGEDLRLWFERLRSQAA